MNFKFIDQSSWIGDIYNKTFTDTTGKFKTNGFFVEIGVGNIVAYEGIDAGVPFSEGMKYIRGGSNTSELLELGWRGIYIEPVKEFVDQCRLVYKNWLDRLTIVNVAASDTSEECCMGDGESLLSKEYAPHMSTGQARLYLGRKIQSKKTSDILLEVLCPSKIDVMSIDVEGYEEKVLRGLEFDKFMPKVLIVETNKVSRSRVESLLPKSYVHVQSDNLNSVFINSDD